MTRPRGSTWVLTAVFVTTLTAYLLVRPTPAPPLVVVPLTTTAPRVSLLRAPARTSSPSTSPTSPGTTSSTPSSMTSPPATTTSGPADPTITTGSPPAVRPTPPQTPPPA